MISKIRPFKEDDSSAENLVGKPIVDPKGDIIATCVEVFEDEKKKKRMRLAIKTDIGTDFIVEETIPVNAISKIGEVILLKKTFEIKPIPVEEIVSFEISEIKDSRTEEKITPEKQPDKHIKSPEIDEQETKQEPEGGKEKKETIEKGQTAKATTKQKTLQTKTVLPQEMQKELELTEDKTTRTTKRSVTTKIIFNEFLTAKTTEMKQTKKELLLKKAQKSKNSRKAILKEVIAHFSSPEIATRMEMASLLSEIIKTDYEMVLPYFPELLLSVYNEPDKKIESIICNVLTQVAIKANSKLATQKIERFFENLLIKREVCQAISISRIHSLNLKIFVNNYDMQSVIVSKYIQQILTSKNSEDIANNLKDFNAIIIAYALIRCFDQKKWLMFVNSKTIKRTFDEHFIDTIDNILQSFQEGNIKTLTEIIKPKLGLDISKKIIANMIKCRIDDFLQNVSLIPLEVLTSFFQDDDNMTVQILFDLINKNEINAQIIFIEDKTYISTRNHA